MTEQKQENNNEGLYKTIVEGAQALTKRAHDWKNTDGFDYLIREHRDLLIKYIDGFTSLSSIESESLSRLLNHTRQYLNETYDVMRVGEMRKSLENNVKKGKLINHDRTKPRK